MDDVQLEHRLTTIESGQGEIKGRLTSMEMQFVGELRRLADNVATQNGRVGKVEDKLALADSFAKGQESAKANISGKSLAALTGIAGSLAILAGAVSQFLTSKGGF